MPKEISAPSPASMLRDPVHVAVTPIATTAERVDQRVIFVEAARKRQVLAEILKRRPTWSRTLVFTRTKHGADKRDATSRSGRPCPPPRSTATRASRNASALWRAFK